MPGDARWTIRKHSPEFDSDCRACIVELQEFERGIDPRLLPGEEMVEAYFSDMHARCRRHAGAILVAELDNEIAGLVMILTKVPYTALDERPGDHALIADLIVRERFRGQGLGVALLRQAEQYAREAGARELVIGVLSGNPAQRLYEHEGFKPYLLTMSKSL
jgi:GNAT superfamily N-acetyltransferase